MSAIGTEDFFVLWFSPCIFHLHKPVQALLPTGNIISETIPFYNKNSTETCIRKMNLITIEWLSHNNLISWRHEDLNPLEELHKRGLMNSSALPSFPKKPRQYFLPLVLQIPPIKEKQAFKSLCYGILCLWG